MTTENTSHSSKSRWSARTIIAFLGFSVIAAFYLWTEHRVHLIAVLPLLPWLILLLCPLMHFFMHGKHGHGGHGDDKPDEHNHQSTPGGE
jgi:hypothetical protein